LVVRVIIYLAKYSVGIIVGQRRQITMADISLVAAMLTVALHSQRERHAKPQGNGDAIQVFDDYKEFLKKLKEQSQSFDVPPAK
jgi:hypothetical protein